MILTCKLLRVVCLIATVLFGAGCQRAANDEASVSKNISLLHYFSFSSDYAGVMDTIAGDFNRNATNNILTVTPLDHESFKSSIRDDLRIGNTADLYSYWAGARVQSMLDKLAPIDDVLPVAELEKLFLPSVVQSASVYNGRSYLLPLTQHYVGFFYNKKIFSDHGLTPPKTWGEFLKLCDTLKARRVVPIALGSKAKWPAQFWFDYLLLRTAPLDYREKLLAGKAAYTDPEVSHVFSLWRGLIQKGLFNQRPNELDFDSGAATMVYRGEAAMTLMGTWLIGYYNGPEYKWREGDDYGFFPFPEIDQNIPPVALGPIDGLVLAKNAKNSAGAKAVLRHFSSVRVQEAMSRGTGAIAPALGASELAYSPMKLDIRREISTASAWAFNYDLAASPETAEIGLRLFAEFIEFPDQYKILLEKTERRMKQLPSSSVRVP